MGAQVLRDIKKSKRFYQRIFRQVVNLLLLSIMLNGLLTWLVTRELQRHVVSGVTDYYATDGETPPKRLQPLYAPNYSVNYLLQEAKPEDGQYSMMTNE